MNGKTRWNLLVHPWIPLQGPEGYREAGLLEALALAGDHRLAAEAYEALPLLRFLLLVAHRALGEVRDAEDAARFRLADLRAGAEAALLPYRERFELLGEDFFLAPQGGEPRTAVPKPLSFLRPDWPTGQNPLLRFPEAWLRGKLPLGKAFRSLLLFLHYHPGGLFGSEVRSLEGAPLARYLAFHAEGPSLLDTLRLNLVDAPPPRPLWERPLQASLVEGYGVRASPAPVERYLFPAYLARLQAEGEEAVGVVVSPGLRLEGGGPDPMLAYGPDGSPFRTPETAFFRAFFGRFGEYAPPKALERAEEVRYLLGTPYAVVASGQATDPQKAASPVRFARHVLPPLAGREGAETLRKGRTLHALGLALEGALRGLEAVREAPRFWDGMEGLLRLPEEEARRKGYALAQSLLEEAMAARLPRMGLGALEAEKVFRRILRKGGLA